jgi:Flp pilus assembly protein TadB
MARFEIFVSTHQTDPHRALTPARRRGRVKSLVAALALACLFIAFLIAALVLGSILAVALIVVVAVALIAGLFKWAIARR